MFKVLDYSGEKPQWRETGRMPAFLRGLRGAKLDGVFHVTGAWQGTKRNLLESSGGFDVDTLSASNSVLAWDPVAEIWSLVGHLAEPRFKTFNGNLIQ